MDHRSALPAVGSVGASHAGVCHVAGVIARRGGRPGCDQFAIGRHGRGAPADLRPGSKALAVSHLARLQALQMTW